jgi:hypothetical protein
MNEELAKLAHLARLFILADEGHEAAMDEARMTRNWKKVDGRWKLKANATFTPKSKGSGYERKMPTLW